MRFEGKVVLITGGTRGIGLAAARLFRLEGAAVAITGRNVELGERVSKEIGVYFLAGDVRRADDCDRVVAKTLQRYKKLDILVNNAGIIDRDHTVDELTEELWDDIIVTNLKGTFLMSKHALPALRLSHGAIVNISSYVGLVGFAGSAAYAASKAGIVNFTRSMALDHAREQVRVNCICPGSVQTDMILDAWDKTGNSPAADIQWKNKHPMGRIATADEIAKSILFLAGDDATFITGAALAVDGGITAE
jgi:NAD(P)-dependent dehydrogenase (short-subunit alcohol dehydrogenase family)